MQTWSGKRTCKWTPGFLRASLDPVSWRVILAEQIQITQKVIKSWWNGKWTIFTRQPLTPANCAWLISAGSLPMWGDCMFLRCSGSLPQHLGFRLFSDLIPTLCFELRCPAGIVNKLPTQTFNLLSQVVQTLYFIFFYSLSAYCCQTVWSVVCEAAP